MTKMKPEEEYSLLQEEIVERLEDSQWFMKCIDYNYKLLADRWGCSVYISRRRLGEAHDFWMEDVGRTLRESMPDGTKKLDHFKNASFIAFWLRRMIPINETNRSPSHPLKPFDQKKVFQFFKHGNEICALLIGFQICLFYEASKVKPGGNNNKLVMLHEDRLSYLKSMKFPPALLDDFAMVLKHKNMSPHSLYMMYRSLFTTIC